MRKKMALTCLIAWFTALFMLAQAQRKNLDVVYLNNGARYEGDIKHYRQGEALILLQPDGLEVEIPDADISKVVQGVEIIEKARSVRNEPEKKGPGVLKTQGFYNTTLIDFAMGSSNQNVLVLGAGISNVAGYQIKPLLGIGLGLGVDNYARRGETVYPVFAEWRGLLPVNSKKGNYYLTVAGGYGFAFKRTKYDITNAEGGYMFHPAIGYRAATSEGLDVNLDLGVKFQKASFTKILFNGDTEILDVLYRRIVVRIGLTLWNK